MMHKDSRLFRGQLKACSFIQSHAECTEANPLSAKAADQPASKLGIFKRLFSLEPLWLKTILEYPITDSFANKKRD